MLHNSSLVRRFVIGACALSAFALSATTSRAQTGACCIAGVCTQDTQAACRGVFQGSATCSPNPCAVVGVCCRGATCSAEAAAVNCTTPASSNAGAQFANSGACNSEGNYTTPCCHADYNKTGGLTTTDIFDFLNDWFAGSPYAKVGGDGTSSAGLSTQDIFTFLNAWFAGCSLE